MSDSNGFHRSASAPAPERCNSVGRRKHFSDGGTLNLFKPFTPVVKASGRRRSVSPRSNIVSSFVVEDAPRSPRKAPGTAARRDTVDLLCYHEAPIDSLLLPAEPNRSPRPSMRACSPSSRKSPRNQSTSWITNPFEDNSWNEIKREKPRRQSTILSVWVGDDRETLDVERPRCQMSPHRKSRIQTRNIINGEGMTEQTPKVSRRRSRSRNDDEPSTIRVLSPSMLPKTEVKRRSRSLGAKMERLFERGASPSHYFNSGMSDAGSRPTSPSPFRRTTFCKEDGTPLPSPSPRLNPHDRYVKGKFDHLRYRASSIIDPLGDDTVCRKKSLPFVPSFMTDGIASRPYGMSPADPVRRFKTSSREPYKEKIVNKKGSLNYRFQKEGIKSASCIPQPAADNKGTSRRRDSSSIPVSKTSKTTSRKGATTNDICRKTSIKAATWKK